MQAHDAADVGARGVDGGVQAEAAGVGREAGAALLHHGPQHVHLHLGGGIEGSGGAAPPQAAPRREGEAHQAGRCHLAARQPLRGHQEVLLLLADPQLPRGTECGEKHPKKIPK